MRIAIFHNYMDNIGGAEIVTLYLAQELNADIYTTNVDIERIKNIGFSQVITRIRSIGSIPTKAPFKQQMALYKFRKLNLKNQYDFYIISGDWAMSAGVNHKPNLWYIHGPINEIWEFKNYVKQNMVSSWKKIPFEVWVRFNRFLTKTYAKHINSWICNSKNTKNRIRKYYQKEAKVIYPPTDTKKYKYSEPEGYWLSVNRLINHKRIEMQIDAFKNTNEKLIVVGSYERGANHFKNFYKKISEYSKLDNIEIKSWISDKELVDTYSKCIGFITTSMNEDFGMTAVEAMASGKPVIAPNEGGYQESVVDGETGILIDNISPEKIRGAMQKIECDLDKYRKKSIKRAKEFDLQNYISQIKEIINTQ